MLNGVSAVTTSLDDARFMALVTTRDGQVVGVPHDGHFETPHEIRQFFVAAVARCGKAHGEGSSPLPLVSRMRSGAITAALAAEPRDRTSWTFQLGGKTRWASQSPVDGDRNDLKVYAIER